jgi:hypothetical protein
MLLPSLYSASGNAFELPARATCASRRRIYSGDLLFGPSFEAQAANIVSSYRDSSLTPKRISRLQWMRCWISLAKDLHAALTTAEDEHWREAYRIIREFGRKIVIRPTAQTHQSRNSWQLGNATRTYSRLGNQGSRVHGGVGCGRRI